VAKLFPKNKFSKFADFFPQNKGNLKTIGHYHVYTFDETLPNFMKIKHPQKGREKETRGKDQYD
jgi:hypothetical protein